MFAMPASGVSASASPPAGTVISVIIPAPSLHGTRKAMIYLPPGYDAPANAARRYPVLYLYSGAPGSQKDWFWHGRAATIADELIAAGTVQPLIMVSPDGNGGAKRDTQFLNSADGKQPVERFLTIDVLSYVDGHYRTVRSARARGIAGYSAGAFGALNVGLHHPDLFSALVGIDGYYVADPHEVTTTRINHPMSANPAFIRFNSPTVTITTIPPSSRPSIFLFVSTVDGPYMKDTMAFDHELSGLNAWHLTRLYAANTAAERRLWPHSWFFAATVFRDNLPAIAAHLQGGSA
jgi:pimeloyl-ACP methyl ester carboxylesterase